MILELAPAMVTATLAETKRTICKPRLGKLKQYVQHLRLQGWGAEALATNFIPFSKQTVNASLIKCNVSTTTKLKVEHQLDTWTIKPTDVQTIAID